MLEVISDGASEPTQHLDARPRHPVPAIRRHRRERLRTIREGRRVRPHDRHAGLRDRGDRGGVGRRRAERHRRTDRREPRAQEDRPPPVPSPRRSTTRRSPPTTSSKRSRIPHRSRRFRSSFNLVGEPRARNFRTRQSRFRWGRTRDRSVTYSEREFSSVRSRRSATSPDPAGGRRSRS